jgi:hypothetical protein
MRTETEKLQFALICAEIEEEGGDVLGYVEMNWPSYSPRGTWHMLQREYLHRAIYSQTEGRPKKKMSEKEKERAEKKRKERMAAEDTAKALMACAENGGNLTDCLTGLGFKNPSSALANVKVWARDHRPAWYPQIANMSLRNGYIPPTVKPGKAPVDEKTGEHPLKEPKAENRVVFNGKEYERAEGEGKPVNEYRAKPSPTCCQPANQGGPILWDDGEAMTTGPEEISMEKLRIREETLVVERPLKIAALVSDIDPDYRYERTNIHKGEQEIMRLIWREPMGGGEKYLTFTVEEWKRFAKEIPQALAQLGL